MTQYLISFDEGAMTFPEEELPDVAKAAHAVVQEATDAGVWVFSGGLKDHQEASVVATDGTVTDGPYPDSKEHLGGFASSTCPHARRRWSRREVRGRLPLCARCPRVPVRPRTSRDAPPGGRPTATPRRHLIEGDPTLAQTCRLQLAARKA